MEAGLEMRTLRADDVEAAHELEAVSYPTVSR